MNTIFAEKFYSKQIKNNGFETLDLLKLIRSFNQSKNEVLKKMSLKLSRKTMKDTKLNTLKLD